MVWNKLMLTVEDANSIIKHFGKGFVDYYTLDTRLLTTVDMWFAYDFIDVYRVTDNISFTIKNSLWTGGYRVLDCDVESPSVNVANDTISVSGTGLTYVILELELSPEFNHDSIFELDYEVEYTPVIRPFYEDIALTMGFIQKSIVDDEIVETPVVGLDVTDVLTGETLTTDGDGLVSVITSLDKHGDFDYILEAENNGHTVDYNFPYTRIQAELPIILLNENVYRDKVNRLLFQFLFDDEYPIAYNHLFDGNRIRLRVDGIVYELDGYNFDNETFWFDVPIGLNTNCNLVLEIGGNDYLDNYTVGMNVPTVYVTVDTASDLLTELAGDNPAGTVVFSGTELDTAITVESDVILRFTDSVVSSLDNVFTVNNGVNFTIDGINFTGKQLVDIVSGTVNLLNCGFQHCTAPVVKGSGDLTVDASSFIDNYSCIDVNGNVSLMNTLFDLSDTDYLDTDNPAFIRCFKALNVDFCQFNLDLHGLTSLGLSYVMFWIGKSGTVNNVNNNTLMKNEAFPMLKNTSSVDVESEHYYITSINNKCAIWTLEDTNTVYSNKLNVEYVEGE